MKNLKEFVNFNGGGDAKHLFAAYFRGNNTQKLQSGKSYVHKLPVIKNILQILKNCHDNAKDFDKRQWLSIVQKAGFSLHQLKDAGWKISTEHSSNLYPGAPVPEKRGRKAIANSVLQSIKKFVCSDTYSYLGSKQVYNDKKYIKKNVLNPNRKKVNVRYRNCTISKLYFSWKEQCKNEGTYFCSSTQFRQVLKLRVKFLKNPKKKQTCVQFVWMDKSP